ncbi:MAG TPA: flavodoxin domain-containing protein [Thermomicrobiaceae bacterium]|nr:flavodoxin domain-containing protein [Thermomicrobiaceae bacterium]
MTTNSDNIRVLIAVASKHGATRGIADAIAAELRRRGLDAEVREAAEVRDIGGYDAVILGSAVYMGKWLPAARELAASQREALAQLPVWLFSSGPLGHENPQPQGEPAQLGRLLAETNARGHRIFAGELDKRELGAGERLLARAVKAPEGDFRDWDAIRAWADEIAAALAPARR